MVYLRFLQLQGVAEGSTEKSRSKVSKKSFGAGHVKKGKNKPEFFPGMNDYRWFYHGCLGFIGDDYTTQL